MLNFEKYRNTIIKLISIINCSEVYGYLIDYDITNGLLKLDKPIISMNRMTADAADTINKIIKYEYKPDLGSTMTVAAATLYPNDGTQHVAYFNYKDFIFVPMYDNSLLSDKVKSKNINQVNVKKEFEEYIEYFYSSMKEFIDDINDMTEKISEENADTDEKDIVTTIVNKINEKE